MKTLHTVEYRSARPGEPEKDNIWCDNPNDTIAFMRGLPEPWIAFKVLAAGAEAASNKPTLTVTYVLGGPKQQAGGVDSVILRRFGRCEGSFAVNPEMLQLRHAF